ncbi:tricalbin SCDLUD_002935 [Saccharomycodes ludwigii]|uniref:tricalbin n=1 Tax=Saccharomycodes ludwigii TaxID=36035 RepID=UPI001E85DF3B|nr:hypothetical protein SCDLUD_002935 [Saccharomycodes ludwigii]KAH3901441.1 hypothetical protein SCDLUD_002935 [Saccharomycodes ludwigii]
MSAVEQRNPTSKNGTDALLADNKVLANTNHETGVPNKSKTTDSKKSKDKTANDDDNDDDDDIIDTKKVTREVGEATYVGWKQVGGWETKDTLTSKDALYDIHGETIIDNYLPDKFYGDWYHSVAFFFIGGFLSFFFGYFKFSLAPVFFVIVPTCFLYRASVKKYRQNIKQLAQKEYIVKKIEDDYESMEWLNTFLDKYWVRMEPAVSDMVVKQVNQLLADLDAIPAFITAIWIDRFTLGVKPPRIEQVKTFQNTDNDVVVMDWTLSLTPHDNSDMTTKQLRNYVNQSVSLKLSAFGITIPVSVAQIAMKVQTRLRFKLMTPFPHIETVNVQILEVPDIDFVAKLFGDSIFSWEIMAIPGLLPFTREMVRKYAGPMLMPPFSMQLNIPQLVSGNALAAGVLELTVKNCVDLKRATLVDISIDPYLEFSINGTKVAETRTVKDTLNPVWNETLFFMIDSFTDPLTIDIIDRRVRFKNKILGTILFDISSLHGNHDQKNLSARFLRNAQPVGTLNFSMHFHPTIEPKQLPDGTVEELPDLNTGISKFIIEEAKHLVHTSEEAKNLASHVDVYENGKLIFSTNTIKGDASPKYNGEYRFIVSDRRKTRFKYIVKNGKNEEIGSTVQTLNDLIDRTETDKTWIPLKNSNHSTIQIKALWKPVDLGIGSNAIAYNPPIGVVRTFINKAKRLPNLEKVGMIDPYARILVNEIPKDRTDVKEHTQNPIWNQSLYVSVTSPNQKITLECMDVETVGLDRSLGSLDMKIFDLINKNSDDKYVEQIDDTARVGNLIRKKKKSKISGSITYYNSFYPTIPILTLEEIQEVDKLNAKKQKLKEKLSMLDEKKLSDADKKKIDEEKFEISELEDVYGSKMKLSLDELLGYSCGVLAVSVLDGELGLPGTYVQAFFDGNGYYRFVSPRYSTRNISKGFTGDVFIKELEWSVCTFRVTKHKESNKAESFISEVVIPTIELVRNCYKKPSILNLTGPNTSKLMVQVQWFPVLASKLPQSDLITNSGDLKITVKSANNLLSADSNGKSDPYIKFYMNDESSSFFKSKTEKKTLDPTWNEVVTVQVNNRVNDYLRIIVMDWDVGSKNDLIGQAILPLHKIDPENPTDLDIPLTDEYKKKDAGVVHLSFEFSPRYTLSIKKTEKKVGDIASKGLAAGTNVVGTGIGAVGKIKKGIFGGKKKSDDEDEEDEGNGKKA